jgi:hypothetical protein
MISICAVLVRARAPSGRIAAVFGAAFSLAIAGLWVYRWFSQNAAETLSKWLNREPPDCRANLRRTGSRERAPKSLAAVVVLTFPGDFMVCGLHLMLSPGEEGGGGKCRQCRE